MVAAREIGQRFGAGGCFATNSHVQALGMLALETTFAFTRC